MSTRQQEKLAQAIKNYALSGVRISKKELLKSVDYSPNTAHGHANKILKAEGTLKALEAAGISTENADNVVKSILNTKTVYEMITPDNQLRAADMIYKRLGAYAPEKLEVRKVVANIIFNKPLSVTSGNESGS